MVVKDAAKGIAAGVSEFRRFHVLYDEQGAQAFGAARRRIERKALGRLGKIRACDKVRRRKAKHALRRARCECAEAIEQ